MKQKPATITTPYPSLDDFAKSLGISKKRKKQLIKMVSKHLAKDIATILKKKAS